MRAAAAWFVKPDGEMTQFGDSNLEPVPDWAQGAPGRGTQAYFGAGFAFVREPGAGGDVGYLAVTDGFHNLTHKHADELSFELFDHGASIVSDTGLYHKDPGEIRDYVVSNRAHSGLVGRRARPADHRSVARLRIRADGRRRGRRLVRDRGPQPAPARQGVAHTRLFLYRPGGGAGDRRSAALRRRPHLHALPPAAPGRRARRPRPIGIQINAPGFAGAVYDAPGDNPPRGRRRAASAIPLQGLSSPTSASSCPAGRSPSPTPGRPRCGRSRSPSTRPRCARRRRARAARARPSSSRTPPARTPPLEVERDRRRLTVSAG